MKKLFWGTLLLALVFVSPIPTMARMNVNVGISLPPIVFAAPPALIVLPGTYIYVVPDVDEEIFFWGGWWWRPWQGRWYRSHYYNSGWGYYQYVPSFYGWIPSGWRNDYREHRWRGQQWNYQRIPQQQVQRNWKGWESSKHWEKQNTWGVQGLKPQTRSQQPSQTVQPKSQAKPQSRDIQQQQSRPQSREVQTPQLRTQSQTVKQQVREVAKPQQSRQQSREVRTQQSRPQSQPVKQQVRGTAKPQQSKPQQGKPERGGEEKQDRK
ncbi:MAG: hypothetical protein NTV01_08625 [Bacteroidia bacterium]|nr:hypothetical protein [Bacteroidia bacterium]